MTCRDICPHLSKMAPQQNRIYFQKVDNSRVSALLELISLAEANRRVPYNCLMVSNPSLNYVIRNFSYFCRIIWCLKNFNNWYLYEKFEN